MRASDELALMAAIKEGDFKYVKQFTTERGAEINAGDVDSLIKHFDTLSHKQSIILRNLATLALATAMQSAEGKGISVVKENQESMCKYIKQQTCILEKELN